MGLGRQAKVLTDKQLDTLVAFVKSGTRFPERNTVIVLLSFYAGLRAKEIALLSWAMVTDAEGNVADAIELRDTATKGRSGRVIPMKRELRDALVLLSANERKWNRFAPTSYVVTLAKSCTDPTMRAQSVKYLFREWYKRLNLTGASSHSGRRYFTTRLARTIGTVGGSIRDVMSLTGHKQMSSVMRYIERDAEAQRKVIDKI